MTPIFLAYFGLDNTLPAFLYKALASAGVFRMFVVTVFMIFVRVI